MDDEILSSKANSQKSDSSYSEESKTEEVFGTALDNSQKQLKTLKLVIEDLSTNGTWLND